MSTLTSAYPLAAFALTAFIIELTPGPNMAYLAALSLAQGARAGLATVAGIALGIAIYGVAAAFGLGALIDRSPFLYEALRWGGVVYLLWLAWDAWRAERDDAAQDAAGITPLVAFRRGLITNLLNPKILVFYVAILPEFVARDQPVTQQTLWLAAIYVAIGTLVHSGIVLLASQSQRLVTSPGRMRVVRRTLAVLLAGIAIWFAFASARS